MTMSYPFICLVLFLTAVSASDVTDNSTCPSANLTGVKEKYDLVFILDTSGESQFDARKNAIKLMIKYFDVSNVRTRLALVAFDGEKASPLIDLDIANNEQFFTDFLTHSIELGAGGRNLAKAFKLVREDVLSVSNGDRPGIPNLCVVVTGGPPDVDVGNTVVEANLLAAKCQVVIVTNDPDASNLPFYNSLSADDEVFQGDISSSIILSQTLKDAGNFGCTGEQCDRRCTVENDLNTVCCGDHGKPILGFNGCCRCECEEGFSGTLCQKETEVQEITKLTYANGNNSFFSLHASSIDPKRPLKKSLFRRNFNNDPYDMYFSFKNGDPNPVYNIIFQGDVKRRLHFLKGQLAAATEGASVTITGIGLDGSPALDPWVIQIPKSGRFPHLDYTPFRINFGGHQLRRVEFKFNKPCECEGCFGINRVKGIFSRVISVAGDASCGIFFECFRNAVPLNSNGCCRCPTPDI